MNVVVERDPLYSKGVISEVFTQRTAYAAKPPDFRSARCSGFFLRLTDIRRIALLASHRTTIDTKLSTESSGNFTDCDRADIAYALGPLIHRFAGSSTALDIPLEGP